jgi:hypothetical protein
MAQGFVYILINPALPGYIKVGKTTKTPEERAKQLSAATGVPTPFVVAYDAPFADCDRAEVYIHTLLETRGISRTPDREFFAVNLREAISLVMEAERNLERGSNGSDPSTALPASADRGPTLSAPVWLDILNQAEDHDYGLGDSLQNQDRALALYKQAARLGAPVAFVRLSELYADRGNADEGLRWLTRGAESGVVECWADLALVYMGENFHFDTPPHLVNARKAWRRFFRSVEPSNFDPEGGRLYGMLRRYIDVVRSAHAEPEDMDAVRAFEHRFVETLMKLPDEAERRSKVSQLRVLVASLP